MFGSNENPMTFWFGLHICKFRKWVKPLNMWECVYCTVEASCMYVTWK